MSTFWLRPPDAALGAGERLDSLRTHTAAKGVGPGFEPRSVDSETNQEEGALEECRAPLPQYLRGLHVSIPFLGVGGGVLTATVSGDSTAWAWG